ncbi:hypothetical protein CMV_030296 [Castanea mollissima]|uniref:Uncharacterized protein n=1 Tax=Castanea mollissima TaxID=60419 RepID=A0A8J4Q5L6_9ROSI|nr:hypothetical protein CMV_030296 [Castanea mollissima]
MAERHQLILKQPSNHWGVTICKNRRTCFESILVGFKCHSDSGFMAGPENYWPFQDFENPLFSVGLVSTSASSVLFGLILVSREKVAQRSQSFYRSNPNCKGK